LIKPVSDVLEAKVCAARLCEIFFDRLAQRAEIGKTSHSLSASKAQKDALTTLFAPVKHH